MDKVSILHIDIENGWGGGQKQTLCLLKGLRSAGIKSVLICRPDSPLHRQCLDEKVPVETLRAKGELDIFAARKISRLFQKESFDIIHAHSAHAHSIALLARLFLKQKPPVVVTRQVAFPIGTGWLNRKKYLARGIRYIAVSAAVRDELLRAGVAESDVRVIPIGIDPREIQSMELHKKPAIRTELGISPDNFLIGAVGTLVECKGHKFLLRALPAIVRRISGAKCIIVGDGPLMKPLRNLAAKLGLTDEVIFTGFRPDTLAVTDAVDLFVLPSLSEGFSYAALEAMALRKPVIASCVGGLKNLIRNGENGLLVPPAQPEQIAGAVINLYDNRAYAERLACQAAQDALTVFTVDNMAKNTIQYYEEFIRENK